MIKGIKCLSQSLIADRKIEYEIEITNVLGNCYDEENVSLEMVLRNFENSPKTFYGFCYKDDKWRFRLCFYEGGEYNGDIILYLKGKEIDRHSIKFYVEENQNRKGVLGVEPVNKKHFCFKNGDVFTAVGENLAWGPKGDNATFFEEVCEKLKVSGANWTRLWLTTEWYLSMFNKDGVPGDFSTSLEAAELLDKILDIFEKNGIYVQLVLFNHTNVNSRRGGEHDRNWHDFSFNSATENGYLDTPSEFFTDDRAKKDVKKYIRYLVSRYGYSSNILCWELFNEVNMAEGNADDIYEWHKAMSEYIRSIDQQGHMVSTSSSTPVYALIYDDMFDFINQHRYGDIANVYHIISDVTWISLCYKKPVLLSECGSSWTGNYVDRTIIHQHLWAGLMCNSAGTGMHWFWENINKLPDNDGYKDLKIVSDFAKKIPWNEKGHSFITAANLDIDSNKINALGYKNNNYYFVWFYDSEFTFTTRKVSVVENVNINLILENGIYEYYWLDCWSGEEVERNIVEIKDGKIKITMPLWKRDITFVICRKD